MTKNNKDISDDRFTWPVFDTKPADDVVVIDISELSEQTSDYVLSDTDIQLVSEWLDMHNKHCKYYDNGHSASDPCGAIGGRLTYSFTPTGLGTFVTVTCMCGTKLDLTDTDNW